MSDMLGISSLAIAAYQRALTTVSNNIANVNTEGYSRQDVLLKDSAPKKMAGNYIGTGVILQRIRRQFDEFAESNLRKSTSDLSNQKPMVDYAKRVVDIMGDQSIGLSSALDVFFGAAGALSADPASTVLRTSFIKSAEGMGSRFAEISSQLDLIKKETQNGIESIAGQINTLTSQLALINQSLQVSPTLEAQPNELLDRRDLTLRHLADLTGIKTSFTSNGTVNVSLGKNMSQGLVVDGIKAKTVGISYSNRNIQLILDPYGTPEPLGKIEGGQVGGYQTFIDQVLKPTQTNLDDLAKTFVNETNSIQKNGIDAYGQEGTDLFSIDPAAGQVSAGIKVTTDDALRIATAAQFRVSEGNSNVTTTRATVKFKPNQPTTQLSNPKLTNNSNASTGLAFKISGLSEYAPITDVFAGVKAQIFIDGSAAGQNLQVMTRDGRQVLGRPLTETEKFQMLKPENGFVASATYSDTYLNQPSSSSYRNIDMFYGTKEDVKYVQKFDSKGTPLPPAPVTAQLLTGRIQNPLQVIPAGAVVLNGLSLSKFDPPNPSGVNDVQDWMNGKSTVTISNLNLGIAPNFRFSANINGKSYAYDLADGSFQALTAEINTKLQLEPELGQKIRSIIDNTGNIVITDDVGREIKNVSLVSQNLNSGAFAKDVAISNSNYVQTGVRATAFSEIRVPASSLNLYKNLSINGKAVAQDIVGRYSNAQTLADAINRTAAIGVTAKLIGGDIVISDIVNAADRGPEPITIDANADGNVLNIQPGTYNPQLAIDRTVRDLRINSADFTINKPLQINGVQILDNFEDAPFAGFLNLTSIDNVSFGTLNANFPPPTFKKFEITIDGKKIQFAPKPIVATNVPAVALNALATDLQAQVRTATGYSNFNVAVVGSGLSFSFAAVPPPGVVHQLNNPALTAKSELEKMIQRTNETSASTGVTADLDINGNLVLSTTDINGRSTISIGPRKNTDGSFVQNALGLEPIDYDSSKRLDILMKTDPYFQTDIRFAFGAYYQGSLPVAKYGDPSEIAQFGLRTAAYLDKGCADDLLVFVTGKGEAKVSTSYDGQPDNVRASLRAQSLQLNFVAPDRYKIVDVKSGTILAERAYDTRIIEPIVEFEGLQIKLTHAPSVGDSYRIDGNNDGLGNNVNILDMVELAKKPVAGGKTIHDSYIDQVNNVGNSAQQATITQQALKVVNEQAIASRDKVSGVNLDDEAASLIRYQQAYQAAAKALQVSGQLFDTIVQIR